jgi:two-component system, cell cycle response regulator DivK
MRITYVEDNIANIALFERICQMGKDNLTTYLDASSAFDAIISNVCDLIVIDLHLGSNTVDGLELARSLRDHGIEQPIVAITSYDHLFKDQYLEAGCNEYIRKPVSVETFLSVIDRYRP